MGSAAIARILLCVDEPAAADDVRQVLEQAGHAVGWHTLGTAEPDDLPAYGLVLLEGSRRVQEALQLCRRLRTRLTDSFVPLVFITGDHSPAARLLSFEAGADTYLLRPFAPGELLAQIRAFLRIKELHARLSEQTAEVQHVNERLQLAYQQIDQELELARRIQMSFLPRTLPEVSQARFAVHYRPCGQVGGDFYDVFRLDENHIGFYIADAMGHGVPASLLTIFLKRGVQGKEITGRQYRLVPPDEVLQRLNRDLLEQALAENPFITMVYALLNYQDGTLHFSRAGHPHPLYVPRTGDPELWQVHGSLLGVFDTPFVTQTFQLHPGDKVLLYTDGIDSAGENGTRTGTHNLIACASRHRSLPIQEFIGHLAQDLFAQTSPPDDVTFLALEMTG